MQPRRYGYFIRTGCGKYDSLQMEEFITGIDPHDLYADDCDSREQFNELIDNRIEQGDTLYVNDLFCLGKDSEEIEANFFKLREKGINMAFLAKDQQGMKIYNIPEGLLRFYSIQQQKQLSRHSAICRAGIEKARHSGKQIGRPSIPRPDSWESVIELLDNYKITAVYAMQMLHLKKNTFYKLLAEYRAEQAQNRSQ